MTLPEVPKPDMGRNQYIHEVTCNMVKKGIERLEREFSRKPRTLRHDTLDNRGK